MIADAPEPSEICWTNLQISETKQLFYQRIGSVLLIVVLFVAAVLVVALQNYAANFKEYAMVLFFSVVVTAVTTTTNFLLKIMVFKLTDAMGMDTLTERESSICLKLTWAYVANSVLIPFLLGGYLSLQATGFPVDGSWYESGGVAGKAWLLIGISALTKDLQKMVPVLPLFNRYVLSRFASSQAKLNALFQPPKSKLGEMYADSRPM